MKELIRKRQLG